MGHGNDRSGGRVVGHGEDRFRRGLLGLVCLRCRWLIVG